MVLTCCVSKSLVLWWILKQPSLHSSIPWKGGGEEIKVPGKEDDIGVETGGGGQGARAPPNAIIEGAGPPQYLGLVGRSPTFAFWRKVRYQAYTWICIHI